MLKNIESSNLDWHREKTLTIKTHGIAALMGMQKVGYDNAVTSKIRCVWPSNSSRADTKVLSRRVWGKIN